MVYVFFQGEFNRTLKYKNTILSFSFFFFSFLFLFILFFLSFMNTIFFLQYIHYILHISVYCSVSLLGKICLGIDDIVDILCK